MSCEDISNVAGEVGGQGVQYEDESVDGDAELRQEFGERVQKMLEFDDPYDPSQEPLPNLAAYSPSFSVVERFLKEIIDEAIKILRSSNYQDTEIVTLVQQLTAHREIKYASAQTVGMVGNAGAGKSSVINALLDTPYLAPTGSSGSACTSVIIEYRQAPSSQSVPFAAEIHFCLRHSRESIIKERIRDYQRYYNTSIDDPDEDTLTRNERRATEAIIDFRAMFADREDFATEEAAKDFLSNVDPENEEETVAKLLNWTEELMERYGAGGGRVVEEGTGIQELHYKIEKFVKAGVQDESDEITPSAWPIVRVARIFMHNRLLEQGLVIADMPGLSDINTTRAKSTHDYTRTCAYLLVTAPIERVLTDTMVQAKLAQGFSSAGTVKLLVCTKIDVMDPKTYPDDLAATSEDTEEFHRLVCLQKSVLKAYKDTEQRRKKLKGKEKLMLSEEVDNLRLENKALKVMCQTALIQMRNKRIKRFMRKKYRDLAEDSNFLQVYCVSSLDYNSHIGGYDEDTIPLSLAVTGIPELRLGILKLPAQSKLDVLKLHCQGMVPTVVGSLEAWALKSATKRYAEIREIVAKPHQTTAAEILKYVANVKKCVDTHLLHKIRDRQGHWTRLACEIVKPWLKWKPATFSSWCKNVGNHKTATKDQFSWNAALLQPALKDLQPSWAAFNAALSECGNQCCGNLIRNLDTIRDDLKCLPGISIMPMTSLMESLSSKRFLLEACINDTTKEMRKLSKDTKLDATTEEHSSFYMRGMGPIYLQLGKISGKGCTAKRRVLFQENVEKGVPFQAMSEGIRDAFDLRLLRLEGNLVRRVEEIFSMILDDFDRMFTPATVKEVHDPNLDELRARLRVFAQKAKAKLAGPVEHHLALAMGTSD